MGIVLSEELIEDRRQIRHCLLFVGGWRYKIVLESLGELLNVPSQQESVQASNPTGLRVSAADKMAPGGASSSPKVP